MKMNLPNRLTMLRVLLIPFFVIAMLLSVNGRPVYIYRESQHIDFVYLRCLAFIIFCVASATDFLDGYIARKYKLVTNFGKFMDPLADKLLVCSALVLLAAEGSMPVWVVLIIIAREFTISGFRLVASDAGIVIAASWWGKWKTVTQMIVCMVLILPEFPIRIGDTAVGVLIAAATILTIVSLVDYIRKNISVLTRGGM